MTCRLLFFYGVVVTSLFVGSLPAVSQDPVAVLSHEKAARELYRMVGGVKAAEAGAEAMMGMVRGNPEFAPYEDVFRTWYQKVFAAGDLEAELAKLYMHAFSEQELQGLIAFYRTPLGQKALEKLPHLMQQATEIGMRRGKEHAPELQAMLDKAKQEREAQKKPGQ
jgi:uncharacterized protein